MEAAAQANRIELHKRAIADADQLQLLAKQLKDELSKSGVDTLSANAIKKAKEIEKLAQRVSKEAQS